MSGDGREKNPQMVSGQLVLSAAIEAVEDACVCFDRDMLILAANAAAQRLFGYGAEELIGRDARDIIRPAVDGGEKEMLARLFLHADWTSAKADWRDVKITAADGTTVRLAVSSVLSSSQGMDMATALFRRSSDAGAATARQLIAGVHSVMHRFLSSMSHELRTPLNAIIGFSDIIGQEVMGPATPQKYAEYARDINGAARHMLDLITDILEFSQLEQNQRIVNITPVDIVSAIRFAAGLAKPMAEKANVSIRLLGLDAPLLIQADERAVRQIVLNLIMSAIR
ncbi:MAG: HAMP domain-containing sensor histidine kinase [Alphaproteobacteria bacterium]